jgi:glycosyltransferase involved in cell wall biosynthesis
VQLHEFGWYPIVITRHWDGPIQHAEDIIQESRKTVSIEQTPTHEVHRLPYKPGISDRLRVAALNKPWLKPLRKVVVFLRLIIQLKALRVIPSRNLFLHAVKLLRQSPGINTVIITGRPFEHFHFGYRLKKMFPNIHWFADYRDEWTSSVLEDYSGFFGRMRRRLEAKAERKWVNTATGITCVAPAMIPRISVAVKAPATVVFNGYDDTLGAAPAPVGMELRLTYSGTLYQTQPVEEFLEALKRLTARHRELKLKMEFPGLAYDPGQAQRVRDALGELSGLTRITDRLPRNEVIELMSLSDALVMLAHAGMTGAASSKIFEYIALRKPVLLYPSDHDILEELMTSTGLGIICPTQDALDYHLEQMALAKLRGAAVHIDPKEEVIARYSRRKQTEKLAQALNSLA